MNSNYNIFEELQSNNLTPREKLMDIINSATSEQTCFDDGFFPRYLISVPDGLVNNESDEEYCEEEDCNNKIFFLFIYNIQFYFTKIKGDFELDIFFGL